jgi:hypothetical protein
MSNLVALVCPQACTETVFEIDCPIEIVIEIDIGLYSFDHYFGLGEVNPNPRDRIESGIFNF